jgi:hypothetical protein
VLALGGVTLAMAPSASADGIVKPGNPTCADLVPGSTEFKFDPPNSGVQTKNGVTVTLTVHQLVADDPDREGDQTGNTVVDFTAVGGTVLAAVVKGGDFANFYDYRPGGQVAGSNLHPPVNEKNKHQYFYGLSHVDFCVGEGTTPTPSVTPSETPSTTPSEMPLTTPSETPSTTPSETPSTTPSETPSTTPSETPSEALATTPSETPSEALATTPSESPTLTATPSESPTVSPMSTTSSTPVGVPTDVDAGLSGGMKNASATTSSSQSIWGIALLTLGGLLVFAGVLKARQRRGQHSA